MDEDTQERDAERGERRGGEDQPIGGIEARRETGAPPPPRHEARVTRRRFLLIAGAVAAGLAGLIELLRLRGPHAEVTGGGTQSVQNLLSPFPVNAVEQIPSMTWDDWTLRVDGLVDSPLTLDAASWSSLSRFSETADLHCVEGWSVSDVRWGGVRPATILQLARARPEGAFVVFRAYTGEYVDCLPLDLVTDPQTVLADTMDGVPLPAPHGGPLRLVVPTQLGYKSVKWVTRMEVTDKPVRGYWEKRGYPSKADLKARTQHWGPAPQDTPTGVD